MNYGNNGSMWITWNHKKDIDAKRMFDVVEGSESLDDVKSKLLEAGLVLVDTRPNGVWSKSYLYANNYDLVEVYLFHGRKLSVSIRHHDSKTPEQLMRFWSSFGYYARKSPAEMQT